ncbi:hypothetical protein CLF_102701 [Clonorchis sinensis]|uniref:Uncharacterized protein n=1 Tax=Clonorchis sinensis TaxID=79923 RepID=G7Y8D6_CLOSI|nr:hypothetical protein CLF_102701 [Clonorchis sinensis]
MVYNRCGRNGCPSNVRLGMQCHTCKAWWHCKCTGLEDDQVRQLANPPDPFVCAICLYTKGAMHSQTEKKAIEGRTNSPLPNHTVQCKWSSLIDVLAAKLELLSKALTDANTKNAATWKKVDEELSSLNEYLALSIPGPLAAKKVTQLSDPATMTATTSLVDRRVRKSRLIICGSFSGKITPTKRAQSLLGSVPSKPGHESLHAGRLRRKGSKRTLRFSSPSAVQKILGRVVGSQKANLTIRRLAEDRPPDARKLGHSSSREEVRKRLQDGASSADSKLKAKPIAVIAPCAPESTPRQTTTNPDSSFHSTTADPSNSKGSDTLEEASLTWTERPNFPAHKPCTEVRSFQVLRLRSPRIRKREYESHALEATARPTRLNSPIRAPCSTAKSVQPVKCEQVIFRGRVHLAYFSVTDLVFLQDTRDASEAPMPRHSLRKSSTRSGKRQPLNDKNKTDPGNLDESLDPVYQSVNP